MSNYRISTAGMHSAAMIQLQKQQISLAKTQTQVSSGLRFQSPAEDPIAATRVLDLTRSRAQLEQYDRNSVIVENRLNFTEQALADVGGVLDRARELVLQANSSAVNSTSRNAISAELRARLQQLVDIGNRRDGNGEYLFAGFSSQTQPFARSGVDVAYAGDQGVRSLQVGANQAVADGFSGHRVFMDLPEANGRFTVAPGVRTGASTVEPGQVVDPTAWVPGNFTIEFTTATDWRVLDAASAVVTSGTYTSGSTIEFNGAQIVVSGTPAAGDTFQVGPAGRKSLFGALDDVIAGIDAAADDPMGRAQLATDLALALRQIDQGQENLLNLRSELGARLSTVEDAESTRAELVTELTTTLSGVQDLDYAEAISRMNQQLVGLQAAQQAYTRIAQLSLFSYL
jgi:flagellar hook-associated protein 3 FlgL